MHVLRDAPGESLAPDAHECSREREPALEEHDAVERDFGPEAARRSREIRRVREVRIAIVRPSHATGASSQRR